MNTQLNQISGDWDSLMTTMSQFRLDTQVSSASLSIGMTKDQVQQAISAAPTMGLVAYIQSA